MRQQRFRLHPVVAFGFLALLLLLCNSLSLQSSDAPTPIAADAADIVAADAALPQADSPATASRRSASRRARHGLAVPFFSFGTRG